MEGAMERATAMTTATNGAAKPSSGETTRPLDKYFPKNLTNLETFLTCTPTIAFYAITVSSPVSSHPVSSWISSLLDFPNYPNIFDLNI